MDKETAESLMGAIHLKLPPLDDELGFHIRVASNDTSPKRFTLKIYRHNLYIEDYDIYFHDDCIYFDTTHKYVDPDCIDKLINEIHKWRIKAQKWYRDYYGVR
jgi:hypothetical protein